MNLLPSRSRSDAQRLRRARATAQDCKQLDLQNQNQALKVFEGSAIKENA